MPNTEPSTHACECPERATSYDDMASWYEEEELKTSRHLPARCPGTKNVRLYERHGQRLWLCSACWSFGDHLVECDRKPDQGAPEGMTTNPLDWPQCLLWKEQPTMYCLTCPKRDAND